LDLLEKNANAAVHQRLSDLSEELADGTTTYDLALSELRCYQECLRVTRAALAEVLGRAGYHWQADIGQPGLRMPVSI
jgi:hypothetical protein